MGVIVHQYLLEREFDDDARERPPATIAPAQPAPSSWFAPDSKEPAVRARRLVHAEEVERRFRLPILELLADRVFPKPVLSSGAGEFWSRLDLDHFQTVLRARDRAGEQKARARDRRVTAVLDGPATRRLLELRAAKK